VNVRAEHASQKKLETN